MIDTRRWYVCDSCKKRAAENAKTVERNWLTGQRTQQGLEIRNWWGQLMDGALHFCSIECAGEFAAARIDELDGAN